MNLPACLTNLLMNIQNDGTSAQLENPQLNTKIAWLHPANPCKPCVLEKQYPFNNEGSFTVLKNGVFMSFHCCSASPGLQTARSPSPHGSGSRQRSQGWTKGHWCHTRPAPLQRQRPSWWWSGWPKTSFFQQGSHLEVMHQTAFNSFWDTLGAWFQQQCSTTTCNAWPLGSRIGHHRIQSKFHPAPAHSLLAKCWTRFARSSPSTSCQGQWRCVCQQLYTNMSYFICYVMCALYNDCTMI